MPELEAQPDELIYELNSTARQQQLRQLNLSHIRLSMQCDPITCVPALPHEQRHHLSSLRLRWYNLKAATREITTVFIQIQVSRTLSPISHLSLESSIHYSVNHRSIKFLSWPQTPDISKRHSATLSRIRNVIRNLLHPTKPIQLKVC